MSCRFAFLGLLGAISLLGASASARADDKRVTIAVGSVDALYAEAEKAENVGAILVLDAGTYALSRPLRLRHGMDLVGRNVYQDLDHDGVSDAKSGGGFVVSGETILDARAMKALVLSVRDCNAAGAIVAAGPEPAVIVGGANHVSRLTVLASAGGVGIGESASPYGSSPGSDDDLVVGGGLAATVSEVVLQGGGRGATLANRGCGARAYRSSLVFEKNVVLGSGGGLTVANFATDLAGLEEGPSVTASVRWNRFVGNGNGLVAIGGAQGTDGASTEVTSIGNVFEGNGGGMFIRVGVNQPVPQKPSSNANFIRLFSIQDVFRQNGTPPFAAIALYGADRLVGGGRVGATSHGNFLEAHIVAATFEGTSPELDVAGGRYRGMDGLAAGTDNVVSLLVRNATSLGLDLIGGDDSPPALVAPVPANRVELVGNETAFLHANAPAGPLPASLESPESDDWLQ